MMQVHVGKKQLLLVIGAVFCWLAIFTVLSTKQASAIVNLNPNPPATAIPQGWRDYLRDCDTRGWTPSLVQWLSPSPLNQRFEQFVTADEGDTAVSLRFNYAGAVCYTASYVARYQLQITSVTSSAGTTTSGLNGVTGPALRFDQPVPSNLQRVGTYDQDSIPFTFRSTQPGGFRTGTYRLTIRYKAINTRVVSPFYDCVRSGGAPIPAGSATDFGACPTVEGEFDIYIEVIPKQARAQLNGSASCTNFSGWAYDPDRTSSKLRVLFYADNTHVTTVTADNSTPRIPNSGHGSMNNVGGHGWNVSSLVARYADYGTHTFRVEIRGVDRNGDPAGPNIRLPSSGNYTIGPCERPTCSVQTFWYDISGGYESWLDPGENYTNFVFIDSYSPGVNGRPLRGGTSGSYVYAALNRRGPGFPGAGLNQNLTFAGNIPPTPVPAVSTTTVARDALVGTYNFTATLRGGGLPAGIPCTPKTHTPGTAPPVLDKPYLGIYGGDAFSGGGFKHVDDDSDGVFGECDVPGDIKTYKKNSNSGSGSQLAAFSLRNVINTGDNGFATARLSTTPTPPDGLLFANDGTRGNFAASADCIVAPTTIPSGLDDAPTGPVSNWPSGVYRMDAGDLSNDSGAIPNGTNITLYVEGDLTIKKDIFYAAETWDSIEDIPSFKVYVVFGNINIAHEVNQLAGIYTAIPTDTGDAGIIDTCTNNTSHYTVTDSQFDNQCDSDDNPFIVYGKLIAQKIMWRRTYGKTTDATASENPYSNMSGVRAAELVIDGPETYINLNGGGFGATYDNITALPPVL